MAFADDPLLRWFYPERDEYFHQGPSAFQFIARRSVAHHSAFTTDDGVAVAMFLPPGRPEVEVEPPPDAVPPSGELMARFGVLGVVMAEHTPPEPHWYLNVLATHPDWQRQGLGAAVIGPIGEVCRRDGLAMYLETQTIANVAYYTHLGFRVRSEWDVPLDGPHLWGMIREP
ncbi:MAG: putative acetyltransferase [Ilumatobacteraceae bacterium]|nr:putative acetyltransferase [Ilumatobacteraceae bacterium]